MMGKELAENGIGAAPRESVLVGRYRFSRSVCYRIDATKLDDVVTSRGPPARSQSHGCSNSSSSSSHEAEAVLPPRVSYKKSMSGPVSYDDQCAAAAASKMIPTLSQSTSPNTSTSGRKGKELRRLLSWSTYLEPVGDEQAIEQAEEWMIDLSQLFLGQRFASGAHSRLYHGMYQGKAVAVKVTRHLQGKDEELGSTLDRLFTREVSLLSRLKHPNIVQLIGACKKPPVCCVVTRYVPGGSLRDFLQKSGGSCLPLNTALRMALDIGRGMHYLHSQGVVHRDLKSENLILDDDLSIKITDFGVARLESECDSVTCDVGTYRWMAPEMVNRRAHSRKVDVYSFGIVLWELLTGKVPFQDMTPIQAAYAVVHKHARPEVPSDCPPALGQLMQHCWSFHPDKRPEFEQVVKRLEQLQAVTNQCQCFPH